MHKTIITSHPNVWGLFGVDGVVRVDGVDGVVGLDGVIKDTESERSPVGNAEHEPPCHAATKTMPLHGW